MNIEQIRLVLDWLSIKYAGMKVFKLDFDGESIRIILEDYYEIHIHINDIEYDLERYRTKWDNNL